MSRSGYSDDCDGWDLICWRGAVKSAIRGKRGQAFLRELAKAMDRMEEKILISSELIDSKGDCCAIGVICKSRGIDVSSVDSRCPRSVGSAVGISRAMAAEIEYKNDDDEYCYLRETPEKRWKRMRKWIENEIVDTES